MPALVFDPATMSTGVDTVDAQHRQLIAMINSLATALEAGDGGTDAVAKSLRELQGYTRSHFTHEEGCMARISCPVAKANQLAHQTFLRSVEDLANDFARTGPTRALAYKLQSSMGSWLKTHIVSTDTKMRTCVPAGVRM